MNVLQMVGKPKVGGLSSIQNGTGAIMGGWFIQAGLAYQGKDFVFRFIIEYSSLRDFGP
jgi:hypothetical protein